MRSSRTGFIVIALMSVLALPAMAEDVENKWRVSFSTGFFNAYDSIESDSANTLILRDPTTQEFEAAFNDPRDESSTFGALDAQAGLLGTASVQYAVSKVFMLEGSIGYQVGDIGDVEVSAQIPGLLPVADEIPFRFETFRIEAGEMTRVPIQISALARMRPRAKFNPYFGGGIGYSFIGFDAADEFNELSRNMDASRGIQARVTESTQGSPTLVDFGPELDLEGAAVDARDTFEWHLAAGAELTIKSNWSLFLDLRWVDASRDIGIRFNGSDYLGVPVPNFEDFTTSDLAGQVYGPVRITSGGLIDAGQLVLKPLDTVPPDTNCELQPQSCRLLFDLGNVDGVTDTGSYYVQGGDFSYDGYAVQFGFRYTFK